MERKNRNKINEDLKKRLVAEKLLKDEFNGQINVFDLSIDKVEESLYRITIAWSYKETTLLCITNILSTNTEIEKLTEEDISDDMVTVIATDCIIECMQSSSRIKKIIETDGTINRGITTT